MNYNSYQNYQILILVTQVQMWNGGAFEEVNFIQFCLQFSALFDEVFRDFQEK